MFKLKGTNIPSAKNFKQRFAAANTEVMHAAATLVTEKIRENVLNETLGIRQKSASWLRRTQDPRPVVDTQEYINGLRPVRLKSGGAAIEGNKQLSVWLEYGTSQMKPMPHIRPTMKQLSSKLAPKIGKELTRKLLGGHS